jgi:putative tryptophan/tyrosine transport system substrate-binding protein
MQFDELKRREFITLLGGAAVAWPLVARAQQHTIPVVGFLYSGTPEAHAHRIAGFRKGLGEAGYVEGHNLTIEYRFAHNEFERLPELAADLVRRRVSVLAALGNAATALAAKDATTSTPVVFAFGGDPIQLGFVASFNRPGGNLTGMSMVNVELAAKHIGLMHELLPRATRFALLINPSNPSVAEIVSNDAQAAGRAIGRQIDVIAARTAREIDEAFASLTRQGAAGLLVAPDTFFVDRRVQLATLATRYVLPTIGTNREYAEAGALMSYGSNIVDQFRQAGIYVGRILKGERAADLPVIRPTRFELVINAQTARILGIEVPPTLLARADEVIE